MDDLSLGLAINIIMVGIRFKAPPLIHCLKGLWKWDQHHVLFIVDIDVQLVVAVTGFAFP